MMILKCIFGCEDVKRIQVPQNTECNGGICEDGDEYSDSVRREGEELLD
jgi:hypothetical protein